MSLRTFVYAALLCGSTLGIATAHEPASSSMKISGVLNFSSPDSQAADALFTQLESNAGRIVQLDLEIKPRQQVDDIGYALISEQAGSANNEFICGDGNYGFIDNKKAGLTLSFHHPENFHSPTTINIGDRYSFPFQSVHCGIESYTSKAFTSLKVSGAFVIFSADIPTATEIVLFPYKK